MKKQIKSKISIISLILLLTISAFIVALPTASAQAEGVKTYPFIGATPNPVGVNQQVLLHVGISQQTTYLTVGPATPTVTIPPYPGYQGPSAQDVANSVVASLPADATPQQVAQAVVNAMPEYPEPTVVPEYTSMDIVLAIFIAIAIVIGIIILFRKPK